MANVALVPGGAPGMGLAVCDLLATEGWHVAIVNRTPDGAEAAKRFNGIFIEADVSDYKSIFNAFSVIWDQYHRLNFVFANAGIIERQSFYSLSQGDNGGLAAALDISTINVNLSGVIFTSHVALHFFRRSKDSGPKSLIMTSSSGGLYPVQSAPIHAASKHGVLGFMRQSQQGYIATMESVSTVLILELGGRV